MDVLITDAHLRYCFMITCNGLYKKCRHVARYYQAEYGKRNIGAAGLAQALCELLNTPAKVSAAPSS